MIHPHTELRYINDQVGSGVFASQFIPRGSIMWVFSDLDHRFTLQQVLTMSPHYYPDLIKYPSINAQGEFLLSWDLDKYCNHSCDPTNFRITPEIVMTIRDIPMGSEVTYDYGVMNLLSDMKCHCHAANCRHFIKASDLTTYGPEWEEKVKKVLPDIMNVPQPLYPFLPDKESFNRIVTGEQPFPSYTKFNCPEEIMDQLKIAMNDYLKE
jgi:hypothetical protein